MNRLNKLTGLALVLLTGSFTSACTFVPQKLAEQRLYEPALPEVVRVPRTDNGAIYQAGMRVGLLDSNIARSVGDILTIELRENTNASATSNTNASKDQKVDLQGPELAGSRVTQNGVEVLKNNVDAGREFSGQGTSAMSSSFNGTITVTVAEVLANGNLVVRGQKLMLFNQSDEFIRLIGIVRPEDIRPNNTIPSTRVADVKLAYSGDGVMSSANTMGPLARFFQGPTWPY
jgi:flagellar L-ring protein precursor FlgH